MPPASSHRVEFGDRFSDRCVCVTGGAGFIGGHLCDALLELGATITVIDDLSASRGDHLIDLVEREPERVRFVYASILDPGGLRDAVEGCQAVFHLAAMGSVPRSLEEPLRCMAVNTTGTVRVLEAAREAGVERVVSSSSSSVYGVGDPTQSQMRRRESDLPAPVSPYAASKLAGEHVVRAWAESYGLAAVSLRYFNVFGPRQSARSDYAAVIPAFIAALSEGKRPAIYGDGSFSRDFTPVSNVVRANLLAASADPAPRGEAMNIGCGTRTTIRELHDAIAALMGAGNVEPEFRAVRAGDVPHSQADLSLARELIGYEPRCQTEEGLAQTVRWFTEDQEDDRPDVIFRIA